MTPGRVTLAKRPVQFEIAQHLEERIAVTGDRAPGTSHLRGPHPGEEEEVLELELFIRVFDSPFFTLKSGG